MAKRNCELCGKYSNHAEMYFGVWLCPECDIGYSKAMKGDPVAHKLYSNPENFPNATPKAIKDIVGFVANKPIVQHKTTPDATYNQNAPQPAVTPQVTQPQQSNPQPRVTYNYPTYTPPKKSMGEALDRLYTNIGKKIKNWAKWIFLIDAIVTIVSALIMMFSGDDALLLTGIILILIGPILAWVFSWILYAFGEMVDKICENEKNTRENEKNTREILKILSENSKQQNQME